MSASLANELAARFGAAAVEVALPRGETTLEVPAGEWVAACTALRDAFGFDTFIDLCGVDYLGYGNDEWDTDGVSAQGFSRGVEGRGPGRFKWGERPSHQVGEPAAVDDGQRHGDHAADQPAARVDGDAAADLELSRLDRPPALAGRGDAEVVDGHVLGGGEAVVGLHQVHAVDARDTAGREYDPDAAHRFWQQLVRADRVLGEFRARFAGKVSPVHFFWGSMDLACTRFSGRPAPAHPGGAPRAEPPSESPRAEPPTREPAGLHHSRHRSPSRCNSGLPAACPRSICRRTAARICRISTGSEAAIRSVTRMTSHPSSLIRAVT